MGDLLQNAQLPATSRRRVTPDDEQLLAIVGYDLESND
jgi:hypothetical protein